MDNIGDLQRGRPLLSSLLRLLGFCVKVSANRSQLSDPQLGAVSPMLKMLRMCLTADAETVAGPPGGPTLTEQLLEVSTSNPHIPKGPFIYYVVS